MRYRRKNKFETSDSPAPAPATVSSESSETPVLEQPSKAEDRYRDLASDSAFQKKAGLDDEAKKVDVEIVVTFKPEDLLVIIDLYAVILSFIFSRILNAKFDVVHKICKFDDDQRKVVSQFMAPVAAKYFPTDWLPYLPEIKLGLCLAGITSSKFQQCMEAVKSMTIDVAPKNV
jgi:hypothetical protein